jgi:hypothetical protein
MKSLRTTSSSIVLYLLISLATLPFAGALSEWSVEIKMSSPGQSSLGYSVIQTNDNGYAISGATSNMMGDSEVWLIKCDSSGTRQWNQSYGLGIDNEYCVIQTADDGYAIAGSAAYYTAGYTDALLIKTDPSGNEEWNRKYGGSDPDRAFSVVQTEDDGYALAGTSAQNFWLLKVDSNGNEQWSRTYDYYEKDDAAYCIIRTSDGGYALAGRTYSDNLKDFLLIKTDSSGTVQWSRNYGTPQEDVAYSLVQTHDGGFALAGYSGTPNFYGDFLLVKTDGLGNELWSQTYGGSYEDFGAYALVQVNDGGYALAGGLGIDGIQRDFWLVRTDFSGTELWNRTYGGIRDDIAFSMTRTYDGGYALAGSSADEQNVNQILLVKAAVGDSVPEPSPSPSPTATHTEPSPSLFPSSSPSTSSSPSASSSPQPPLTPGSTNDSGTILSPDFFYVVAIIIGITVISIVSILIVKKRKH